MQKSKYNTNLAAEFYVLSVLHRLGADAALTLGNKKSMVVVCGAGGAITVDVKGLAGTTSWPVDNVTKTKSNHFLVFVCYNNKIDQPIVSPDVWIMPSTVLKHYRYVAPGGRRVVFRGTLLKRASKYKNAWHCIA